MEPGHEEGWYADPYGLHEARWFSDGSATKLVRDAGQESYDEPPSEPPPHPPEPIEASSGAQHGDDLRRADDPESGGYDRERAMRTGLGVAAESMTMGGEPPER